MRKTILLLLLLMFLPFHVFGWGPIGHRTSGLIADAHLTPQAKAAVKKLLFEQSLADIASWADSIKSTNNYLATHYYHFESIPDGAKYLQNLKAMPQAQKELGGVVQAIIECQTILRSPNAPLNAKIDALKFAVHFIADVHQPFHTGKPEDRGGTKIPVVWFGTKSNLHAVWDSGLIITGHQDIIRPNMSVEEASQLYAQYLVTAAKKNRVVYERSAIETWLTESMSLRGQAYDQLYNKDQIRYQALNLQYVDARVLYSGLRIADTLNQIFANTAPPSYDTLFKQQIEAIIGSISKIINLRP